MTYVFWGLLKAQNSIAQILKQLLYQIKVSTETLAALLLAQKEK